jgi:predicted DNA binding CopG/RHH family protein
MYLRGKEMRNEKKLDDYEQEIEDNFEKHQSVKASKQLAKMLQSAAKAQLKDKKPITIRIAVNDIEAMKFKASKCGVPYQTYINMLIHKDATSL